MTVALIKYVDRWAVDDPVDDYVIMQHDIAMYALMCEGEPMKIRRVTLEVEVSWECDGNSVLEMLRQGFDEIGYDSDGSSLPYQAQVVSEVESPNTQIGNVLEWPPES